MFPIQSQFNLIINSAQLEDKYMYNNQSFHDWVITFGMTWFYTVII